LLSEGTKCFQVDDAVLFETEERVVTVTRFGGNDTFPPNRVNNKDIARKERPIEILKQHPSVETILS